MGQQEEERPEDCSYPQGHHYHVHNAQDVIFVCHSAHTQDLLPEGWIRGQTYQADSALVEVRIVNLHLEQRVAVLPAGQGGSWLAAQGGLPRLGTFVDA